ncbi:MAG: ATP-binding protein, partial [Lachnospiraceae bacterium]|nr:ATP-binding protein [Lachnospiraceae bacterium]
MIKPGIPFYCFYKRSIRCSNIRSCKHSRPGYFLPFFRYNSQECKYIALIDENLSIDENIINLFFTKEGYLYEETDNLLTQEFREVDTYSRIIETISLGANQVTEIADKTGVATQNISYFLRSLLETGIIKKKSAITEEHNKKKIIYVLNDEMLSFWYRFIPDAIETIEAGNGEKYYYRNV